MLDEKHEEIMEAIWSVCESSDCSVETIRKRCPVDFSGEDLLWLEQRGLIVKHADKISLSDKGKTLAEKIIRRHRLAEVLLSSILMLKKADMEKIACQVEHSLQPEIEESICTLLGHPEFCPDGKPIPRGKCCANGLRVVDKIVVSLQELKPGESGKITYIKPVSHSNFHQLISFGLHPGIVVTVHRTTPAFCIKFEQTELALDREVARNIFVWKINL